MFFVDYKCEKCGKVFDITLESMNSERPKTVACEETSCDGEATYYMGQLKGSTTVIPSHMQAISSDRMKYNTISREKKKYK